MDDGEDFDSFSGDSVNDPVILVQQLADGFVLSLGDDPSQPGESKYFFDGEHDLLNQVGGVEVGVSGNVVAQGAKVFDGGVGPDQLQWERKSFFTSS